MKKKEKEEIEQFYLEDFKPLVQELIKRCNEHKIPCFMAFGIKQNEDMSIDMVTEGNVDTGVPVMSAHCLLPELMKMQTNDERFVDFVNVVNGFKTYLKPVEVIDHDEIDFPADMEGGVLLDDDNDQ